MTSPSPAQPLSLAANHRSGFAVRALRSFGFSVAIALLISGTTDLPFGSTLVRSVCIGMLAWFGIDIGRIPLARWRQRRMPDTHADEVAADWPGWPLMLCLIVVSSMVGMFGGDILASLILGAPLPRLWQHAGDAVGLHSDWPHLLALLAGSILPGLLITYWFYSRSVIASQEAAVQSAQRQAAEHQLKLLEAQLDPHMLFNTLANLRVLIASDPARAQIMLDQMISFLRATLSGSRAALHPLRDEFGRLADYLALFQVRMGDRLQVRFVLPAELADEPVPPMLLQPLVENCLRHGLEPAVAGGRVEVSAARNADALVLQVRDTGVGLGHATSDSTRFGLQHVRERLASTYATQGSLTLEAVHDAEGGTLATIRVPMATPTTTAATP